MLYDNWRTNPNVASCFKRYTEFYFAKIEECILNRSAIAEIKENASNFAAKDNQSFLKFRWTKTRENTIGPDKQILYSQNLIIFLFISLNMFWVFKRSISLIWFF